MSGAHAVTPRHVQNVIATRFQRRLRAAAAQMVLTSGATISQAAEKYDVEEDALRAHMGAKTKKRTAKGLEQYKGQQAGNLRDRYSC